MPQIRLENIQKTFTVSERPAGRFSALRGAFARVHKEVRALDNLSFTIAEGELVGYIGPNGAGTSTTVKVMSGILVPDGGHCEILGRVPWQQRVAHVAEIGVVFGQRSQLWWDVPVQDSFDLLRDIYNVDETTYRKRLNTLADVLSIGDLLKTPVRQLSLGQRMRCEVTAALLHGPRILFLDEPTIGLDTISKLALRSFLKEINRTEGVTMILTTHDMTDIEALCQRVMVIGHGKLLYDGALSRLKQRYAPLRVIRAVLPGPVEPLPLEGAVTVQVEGNHLLIGFDPLQTPAATMVARVAAALPITDITVEEQGIDEMVAAMYRELVL